MRILRAVLVAPSRYHEGRVAVFRVGISPNGALGAIAGLAEDYNRRYAGESRVDYEFFDEHVREAVTPELLRRWRDAAAAAGERFVLMICGIQTVTYPRARDMALMARGEGVDVLAGGVHLSGHGPSVEFLVSSSVGVAIGEVEPIWDDIVRDALDGRLRPLYQITAEQGVRVKAASSYMTAPDITDVPFPHIPPAALGRYVNPSQLYIDGSRGCPFLCTFCVVKNVFGRTVRSRDPERLAAWMAERSDRDGIRSFSFTDDNFVRNPRHLELLDHLAAARARDSRFTISLILDVESTCYAGEASPRGERSRDFLRRCEAAGVAHVYIGLESTNDAVLQEMRKGVNRDRTEVHDEGDGTPESARRRLIARYRAAVDAWHSIGTSVECGYIIGFEADGPGIGLEAAHDLIEIGVDVVAFFLLSPLPGAEDYARALRDDLLLERDFNEYFQHRPLIGHPTMTPADLEREMKAAVRAMWSWANVLRRLTARAFGIGHRRALTPWTYFKRQLGYRLMLSAGMYTYVEGGLLRRRGTPTWARLAVTDAEARRRYLGDGFVPRASGLSAAMLDDASMESLPVLGAYGDTAGIGAATARVARA